MNFIPSIVLSSVLLLTLTACNSGNDVPKPKILKLKQVSIALLMRLKRLLNPKMIFQPLINPFWKMSHIMLRK
jgi:hypothetical protein